MPSILWMFADALENYTSSFSYCGVLFYVEGCEYFLSAFIILIFICGIIMYRVIAWKIIFCLSDNVYQTEYSSKFIAATFYLIDFYVFLPNLAIYKVCKTSKYLFKKYFNERC
jgi:hypothetical protein